MERKNLRRFIHTIYSISGKIHHIRNVDIPLKLDVKANSATLSMLNVISENHDLNMSEISSKMGLTKGAVSQMVAKLQQKGLVEKNKSVDNAKNIFLIVTDKGRQALEEYYILHDKLYDGMFEIMSHYSEEESEIIWKFLKETDSFLTTYKHNVEDE